MLNADSGHIGNGIKKFYDPIERAEETAQIACRGNQRKYYRFRPARDVPALHDLLQEAVFDQAFTMRPGQIP